MSLFAERRAVPPRAPKPGRGRWFPAFAITAVLAATGPAWIAGRSATAGPAQPRLFSQSSDVGGVARKGSSRWDAAGACFVVDGGGENMWAREDAFHFVWTRLSGDIRLAATIRFATPGGNPHKKACLMIRQSLDADSAYADAALHGDGLASLQFREEKGGLTHEVQSSIRAPARLQIVKEGEFLSMRVARNGEPLRPSGGAVRLRLSEPFYVGLAVCAHDNRVLERAEFRDVQLENPMPNPTATGKVESTLEVVSIASGDRRAVLHTSGRIEAPNWSRDGRWLIYNGGGRIHRVRVEGGQPETLDTGFATRCNNDHGLSPDGSLLAVSHHSEDGRSRIYVLPAEGGAPRLVTPEGPSYWHGWSPDGRTLAYCGERGGEFDIYTIPVEGGPEKRLTTAPGLDDGPDYSPDGRWIYFNSERAGLMQIWRMRPDGTDQQAVTADACNNWFPHPSPDGKWLVFLSYDRSVKGHPPDKDVRLRIMSLPGGEPRDLVRVFGGQGTLNVPSWSPDSRQFAFVSYKPASD